MNTSNTLKALRTKLQSLVSTIGLVATASVMSMILIALLVMLKLGSIHNAHNQKLAALSKEQTVLSVKFVGTIDDIDLALRTQSWNTLEPSLATFIEQYNHWITTHEKLSTERINRQITGDSGLTIADQFDRIAYNKAQIIQSVSELKVVTDSIARRAPYISQSSRNRVFASAQSIRDQFPAYIDSINQISSLYESHASQSSKDAVADIKHLNLLLIIALICLPWIAIAPKIRSMQSKQQALQAELLEAQAAASHRWSLLASLGHQFRNPMSSIIGFASLLMNEQQDEQTKAEHARQIHSASTGLNTLIEDILQISSIEAGTFRINPQPTDLRTLFSALENRYQPIASSKELSFSAQLDESCPSSITTDEHQLYLLLSKLIDNAIEFTQSGSINIQASLEQHDEQDRLTIRVVDTGIGIKHDQIPRIFDPFRRIQTEKTQEHQGVGLGLTIARAIAKLLGGNITIESAPGAGCFVTVTIDPGQYTYTQTPASIEQSETVPVAADHAILESKLVLIIEDADDNQRLLSHFMTKAGCIVQLANNGQEGIDRVLEARKSGSPFDLILMDMQMPVLNGFEATAILREDSITTPIIGVTAYTTNDDRTRVLQAGCDAYLPKPIGKTELLNACAEQLHLREQRTINEAA